MTEDGLEARVRQIERAVDVVSREQIQIQKALDKLTTSVEGQVISITESKHLLHNIHERLLVVEAMQRDAAKGMIKLFIGIASAILTSLLIQIWTKT